MLIRRKIVYFLEVSSRNVSQIGVTEDSSRVNTQQTTRGMPPMPPMSSSSIITIVIIAVIPLLVVITVPKILLLLVLYFRKLCKTKKEKRITGLLKRSEGALDDFMSSNLNDMQSKNDGGPLYSEVSEHTKKSEEKTGNSNEEKNDEVSEYYCTVKNKEELNSQSEVVPNDLDWYVAVDASAKWKTKLQEETSSVYDIVY